MFLEKRMTNQKGQVMTYEGLVAWLGKKTELRLEKRLYDHGRYWELAVIIKLVRDLISNCS